MAFAFDPYEPGFDEERDRVSRRRWRIGVVLSIVLLIVIPVLYVLATTWSNARRLDPSLNFETGLPDGSYILVPSASYHRDEECWFTGTPHQGLPSGAFSADITLYGRGTIQCGGLTENYGNVLFDVTNGIATIAKLKSY